MRQFRLHIPQAAFFAVFLLSGFSGLIYESIWSHYLKLFLGHAAYAQVLVLAIFMGGMAAGAALAARFTHRIRHALLGYALVEGLVGIAALVFHKLFVGVTDWAFDAVIPDLGSPAAVEIFKWSLAAALILPQSILLGSTFPLMSAGLVRRDPARAGYALSMLYFTNSLGAAAGVLVSGFVLIGAVGLPGTILTAGVINVLLALTVWFLARSDDSFDLERPAVTKPDSDHAPAPPALVRTLLLATFLGSAASFFYEIGWIRMLSLVLGSATHSFELMLSAFILGLALGSFAIRRRLDSIRHPLIVLAGIQIVMGVLAALTIPLYHATFDMMAWGMQALARSEQGYLLFNSLSHAIALLIMLPATICAGMTLPLITHTLLRAGDGERSIGRVYAVNTVGAIVGVVCASLIIMPSLGLRSVILFGAAADILVALLVFAHAARQPRPHPTVTGHAATGAIAIAAGVITALALWVPFDALRLSSGVFRTGQLPNARHHEMISHHDGATASIDVVRRGNSLMIATNGKIDAAVGTDDEPALDEGTMTLLGALPLFYHSAPKHAAVIGFGSGYTTHVLLGDPGIEHVDTIEIEPAMVAGAMAFRDRLPRAFDDQRSHIRISDAKTWFSAQRRNYDLIIAEPSNPWVSGVASLFSEEFYRHVRHHLHPDGIFVQWLHVYEIDLRLVSTILSAMIGEFPDIHLYFANDSDLLVVATPGKRLPELTQRPLALPELRASLAHIGIDHLSQIDRRRLGGREALRALSFSQGLLSNSDYFPVLDQGAGRARYLKLDAGEIYDLRGTAFLLLELIDDEGVRGPIRGTARDASFIGRTIARAAHIRDTLAGNTTDLPPPDSRVLSATLRNLLALDSRCGSTAQATGWLEALHQAMSDALPFLEPNALGPAIERLLRTPCLQSAPQVVRDWVAFYRHIDARDYPALRSTADGLLAGRSGVSNDDIRRLSFYGTIAAIATADRKSAARFWDPFFGRHEPKDIAGRLLDVALRLYMR